MKVVVHRGQDIMLPATDFLLSLSAVVFEAQTLGKLICVSLNGKLIDIDVARVAPNVTFC